MKFPTVYRHSILCNLRQSDFSISVFSISPVSNSALEPAGRYPSVGCERYCSIRFASSYEYGISRFCNTFSVKSPRCHAYSVTPVSILSVLSQEPLLIFYHRIHIFSNFCRISLFLSSASSVSLAWADTSSVVAEIV